MKILLIGATGMLGKPVAGQLIRSGFEVTILARDPVKTQSLFPSAKLIRGDVFDRASLVSAFGQADTVYMNLSVSQTSKERQSQPEREGVENIIFAARETRIKRLVYLSSLIHFYEGMNGFSWWAFRVKQDAVRKIKDSGIPFTIYYPSTFMETLPYQMMQGKKIGILGKSVAPMWFIAAADYANQVARSLEMAGSANKEYIIQGPAPFTFDEAVKVFVENYKKEKLKTMKLPLGIVRFLGNFSPRINYAWHICGALNKYPEKFESERTWAELGKPVITLAEYARCL